MFSTMIFKNRLYGLGAVLFGLLLLLLSICSHTTNARAHGIKHVYDFSSSKSNPNLGMILPIVSSTPDEDGGIYHEVQSGNTIWNISEDYGIDFWELLTQNDLTYESIIHPGDIILIQPSATQTSTPGPTQILPSSTPTAPAGIESIPQIAGTIVPTETRIPWQSIELAAPFPRTTLLIIFLILGGGLFMLAIITILINYNKL